jgi:hypothetical protein
MSVGWRLAEEIAWARPERPGPEWWTLLDIAQDARDDTRQSMPGHDYLMGRGKCSRATLYRRLKALADGGLLKVIRRSAPGSRAIYEVLVIHETGLTIAETRNPVDNPPGETVDNPPSGLTNAETRPAGNGSQNESERVSKTAERVSRPLHDAHAVKYPVTTTPSAEALDLDPSPVEGARARLGQAPMSSIERAAYQAAAERHRQERQETQ